MARELADARKVGVIDTLTAFLSVFDQLDMARIAAEKSDNVDAIRQEQVQVVADLSEISAASGSYTVSATIRLTSPGDVAVVGSYQVRVNISEPLPEPEPEPQPGDPVVSGIEPGTEPSPVSLFPET